MNARKTSLKSLSRKGAALALILGAAQAGATTYTVPLQFNITLTPPVCSLTVGGVTADATTPSPTTGGVVNLTPTALSAVASPNAIVEAMSGFVDTTTSTAGVQHVAGGGYKSKRMQTPPAVSVICTKDTTMKARVTRASDSVAWGAFTGGKPGGTQSGILPIGMALGIVDFVGGSSGTGGTLNATTNGVGVPLVNATASGSAQPLTLGVGIYSASTDALTASYAGLWTYAFNVSLEF